MEGKETGALAKEWARIGGSEVPVQNTNMIDLQCPSALEGVSISENLPELYNGNWHTEEWHECIDSFPSEASHIQNFREGENRPPTGVGVKEVDRWNFVMNKLIKIENNTSNLTRNVNTLSSKVDAQADLLKEVKGATTSNEQKINDLYRRQDSIAAEVDQRVEAKFKSMEASMQQANVVFQAQVLERADEHVRNATQEMQDDYIQGQCNFRKLNLLFIGIKEAEGEQPISVISSFLKNRMNLSGIRIDTAYRLGKPGGNNPRPILARFPFLAQRQRIWFSKSTIKANKEEGKVWIQEDLPKTAKHAQRTFYRVLKKAKSIEGRFEGAHIRGQSLYIDGQAYRVENLESLPDVLKPSSLATLQSEDAVAFFGRFSPLSNHHPSPFVINGKHFTCMEQFLAWSRASLAEDQDLISKALSKADPVIYKGILNDLRNNKPEEWKEQIDNTALLGLRAKFQQNPSLAHFLCSTHPKVVGEASLNKTWGTGFTLTHHDVLQHQKWPKQGNLLGRSLMVIREELMITKND